ncbi:MULTISPECIES: hypothetical protein [Mesorhizobium]|uniref:hypothetical protein n=1 Tax=Mesorhizobium TaxID=68287 RepID=UPI0003CEC8B1|nr:MULTISPECIES: hypothetical protein [Mesorhizobium]ESY66841.1 hypothetical protein X742_16760 [Mesorhizobium sp. LNHC232B00]WJI41732.1 hypothetical protein NL534_16385 [Mesorhizobium opportunistum]
MAKKNEPAHQMAALNDMSPESSAAISNEAVAEPVESPQASVGERLSVLFNELHIVKAVVVDDRLKMVLDAALVARIVGDNEDARATVTTLFPNIDLSNENEFLADQVGAILNTFSGNQRDELAAALAHFSQEAADVNVQVDLTALMPAGFPIEYLTPAEWEAKREALLAVCTTTARTLFFFDQELDDGAEGTAIISSLAQQDAVAFGTRWFCGLLSHILDKGEEVVVWRALSDEKKIPLKLFMPISKQNLHDGAAFYGAVYRTVINIYTEKLKDLALDAFGRAMSDALTEFRNLDPIDFEHIIAKSSEDEGVGELETLIRVYSIVQRDRIKKELLDQERLSNFLQEARTVKKVADVGRTYSDEAAKRRAKLRYKELYEAPELINQFRDPLRNGDLFEIGSGTHLKLWMLIAQPCDLMVRSDGKRAFENNFKVAVLAPVKRGVLGSPPATKPGYGFELARLDHDGMQAASVVFTQATPIALEVLDLAVLRADGKCEIETNGAAPTAEFSSMGWDNRAVRLRKSFTETATKIEERRKTTDNDRAKEYAGFLMPAASPDVAFRKYGEYANGKFSYAIKRAGRVREPFATSVLAAFSRYLSRDAYEHDFSAVREIDA